MQHKIPELELDGTLTQENAFIVYHHYLNTERENFDGVKKKPTKSAITLAMIKNHSESKINLIQEYIDAGKKVYFWSDQHFGHANIIKYSNRPFQDKSDMDKTMIQNYLDIVQQDDLVVWVGDVAFGGVPEYSQAFNNLPGKKILIMGNHDFDRKNNLKDFGIFSETYMSYVFNVKIDDKMCNLIITHYPIKNHFLPKNTLNIHGHIHDKTEDFENINVCVEQTNYKPIDITNIIIEKFALLSLQDRA